MKLAELRQSGVLIATWNAGKVRELQELLEPFNVPVRTPAALGLDLDVEETGLTFRENAALKVKAFMEASGLPALADDSGLMVDALNGEPGVFSARYGGPGLSDEDRVALLLRNLASVPAEQRTARFVCSLAFLTPGESEPRFFEGVAEGRILFEPRGTEGFGYDPVFEDPETGLSYAELSPEEKNERSHRAKALRLFIADLSLH